MRTVYLLTHKASSYSNERKILRAYEVEADANDIVKLMAGIVSGTLEVTPVDLVAPMPVAADDIWRIPSPPSIEVPFQFGEAPGELTDEFRQMTPGGAVLP